MRSEQNIRAAKLVFLLLAAHLGCGAGSAEPGYAPGGASVPSAGGGRGGGFGLPGSGGAGGQSGAAADAGRLPPSGGGAVDASAGAADGSVSPPPAPPAPPPIASPTCAVTVLPLAPQRFANLPAGAGYRLRLGGRAEGNLVPVKPTWRWSIVHESNLAVAHTVVDGDPAVIEFPTEMTGRYNIVAEIVGLGQPCVDRKTANALVPERLFAKFRVRATPPAGRPLALFEADVLFSAGTSATKTIDLQRGFPVTIDPQDERGFELNAFYVRMASRSSTARFDGYVMPRRRMGFQALLEAGQRYDVLLVPDSEPGTPVRAPLAFLGVLAEEFGLQSFRIDPGVQVIGTVVAGEMPVGGTRVRLRSGALPSTVGETSASGSYALRARSGRFEVRVLPPEASGLPEAQLPQSTGMVITDPAPGQLPLDFTYAPTSSVRLALTVQGPGGSPPVAGTRVVVESMPDALPFVGTFTIEQREIPAAGNVRRTRTTDALGVATFEALPRARYRAILIPPEDAPGDASVTAVADLDLGTAAATAARTVTLGGRSRLTGRLTPDTVAAGLVIKAVDSEEDGAGRTVTTTVAQDGRYELPLDPGRVFRLFIEPPSDRRVPRIPLEPIRGRTTDITLDRVLPARLGLSGFALENGSPLAGVLIQVFCVGSAPDCIDPEAPDITSTPAIDETVSAADGRYQLYVPDPGQR